MRSQQTAHKLVISTAAAAALMLSGCGPSGPQPQATTATDTSSAGAATTNSPATPGTPSGTPAAAASATATAGAPGLCRAAGLSASTDASGGGAAGSVYMKLNLTNTGSAPCVLRGFAGVSLAADAAGAPIGAPAARDEAAAPVDVLLAPGQTGSAALRYTQAGNYPDCAPVDAAGYRIYPPEDTASLFLPQPTKACSNAEITLLTIGSFQPA